MSALPDDVVLNIYELSPASPEAQGGRNARSSSLGDPSAPPSTAASRGASFLSRFLPRVGLGAYHTSVDVNGYCYTFAAGGGIQKTQASSTAEHERHVPGGATFKESIVLGMCRLDRGRINEVVHNLRRDFFKGDTYHLLNRNCNSFTETFATALVVADSLVENDPPKLDKYPAWVNRLARTGTAMGIDHGDVCDPIKEARKALGLEGKVGWDLSSSTQTDEGGKKGSSDSKKKNKKELTEKQKAALAKLKGSTK